MSYAWLEKPGNHLITLEHTYYPPLLATIHDPPPILFVTGDPAILCQPQIAIVGTRNPSQNGINNAWEFAKMLATAGYTITSGLALGVDAAAHSGALTTGTSIAVSATGPDRIYPGNHLDLARQISTSGALVTELPPGVEVRRENFPRRNRIISGLSLGTLVVEAAAKSGALITAKYAVDQGREVFAIPGSIHNPLSRGCHALIRQGAKLVETAQDIVEELGALTGTLFVPQAATNPKTESKDDNAQQGLTLESLGPLEPLEPEHRKLLDCMGHDPVAQEALIQRSGLAPHEVAAALSMLEVNDYVKLAAGGRYCRTRQGDLVLGNVKK
jgi:DNA processing protein